MAPFVVSTQTVVLLPLPKHVLPKATPHKKSTVWLNC